MNKQKSIKKFCIKRFYKKKCELKSIIKNRAIKKLLIQFLICSPLLPPAPC